MADTYKWATSVATPWSSMTTTTLLNDIGVGDLTTYESSTNGDSVNTRPTLSLISVQTVFVAQVYLATSHRVSAATAELTATRDTTAVGSECVVGEDSPTASPDSATWTISAWDGVGWVSVATGAVNVVSSGEGSDSTSVSASFTPVNTCWLKLTVVYNLQYVTCEGGLDGTITVSDFRYTGSDLGITCREGDGGGDGEGTDDADVSYEESDLTASTDNTVVPTSDCFLTPETAPAVDCFLTTETTPALVQALAPGTAATVVCDLVPGTSNVVRYLVDSDGAFLLDSDGAFLIDSD